MLRKMKYIDMKGIFLLIIFFGLSGCGSSSGGGESNSSDASASGGGGATIAGLDLSNIPWHNGSGAWGPRVPIQFPSTPVTTRTVNVSTPGEFTAEAAVPGTEIVITSGWAGNINVAIAASDIDVVIPAGVSVGGIEIGVFPRSDPVSRVRIRGRVPGTHSGGRFGQYRDFDLATDIIIDGVDVNGDSAFPGGETNQAFRTDSTRIAVINTRAIAGGFIWLGSAKHVIILNSNFYHGGATRAATGFQEGWGIRNTGGPVTIVGSRIQGTRYHNIRVQSVGGTGELLYIGDSVLVAVNEGRTAWLWNNLNVGPWLGQGAIIEDSKIYSYTAAGCAFGQDINAANVTYSRVSNNEFFGGGNAVFTQNYLDRGAANGGRPGDHDWSIGNTFSALVSVPPWTGPGDPRDIPLPNGMVLNTGEAPCSAPQL